MNDDTPANAMADGGQEQDSSALADRRRHGLLRDVAEGREARGELARTLELLQLVADGTPALVAYVDADLRYRYVNASYERTFGRPRAAIVGRTVAELLDRGLTARCRERLQTALRGETVHYADSLEAANGERRWIDGHCTPDVGPDGRVRGVVVSAHDVTELRQSQQRLEATTGMLQLVADQLPAMVAFVDAQSRYRFANARYADWFGRARGALLGAALEDVIGAEAFARAAPHVAAALEGRSERFDNCLVSAAGAPRWMEVSYEPVRDDRGSVVGFVKLLRDIDERRSRERRSRSRAAELAREVADAQASSASHAARLAAVVATAADAIVTIDENGTIGSWNPAAERMFGWSAAEAVGRGIALVMTSSFRGEPGAPLGFWRANGSLGPGTTRALDAVRRDGSTFPVDVSVGEGIAEGRRFWTAIIRDTTERYELQAKLAQVERLAAVGELAAGVAHEVNNPINTVINSAQLIKDGDDAASNCDVILAEGARVAAIVRALLQFARDDQDLPRPVAIPDVLARTLSLVGESFKSRGIELRHEVGGDLPPVLAGPQQLQQVLLNLLINAKDALLQSGFDEPMVVVSAAADERGVALVVSDNGPGIPTHLGDRIFEPFVTTRRGNGGTGLGLSISRSLVEGYGGRICVTSAPGRGAEFRVWLPRATGSAHDGGDAG